MNKQTCSHILFPWTSFSIKPGTLFSSNSCFVFYTQIVLNATPLQMFSSFFFLSIRSAHFSPCLLSEADLHVFHAKLSFVKANRLRLIHIVSQPSSYLLGQLCVTFSRSQSQTISTRERGKHQIIKLWEIRNQFMFICQGLPQLGTSSRAPQRSLPKDSRTSRGWGENSQTVKLRCVQFFRQFGIQFQITYCVCNS